VHALSSTRWDVKVSKKELEKLGADGAFILARGLDKEIDGNDTIYHKRG